jgi:hypothetical protein
LRDSVARDIHDDMSAIRSNYLYEKTRSAMIGSPSVHKGRTRAGWKWRRQWLRGLRLKKDSAHGRDFFGALAVLQ